MKEPWYVIPAKLALSGEGAEVSADEVDELLAEDRGTAFPLVVLPPTAPRLPRRITSRKKEE